MKIERKGLFNGHTGSVYSLLPLSETEFLSGSGDGYIVKWNITNDQEGILMGTVPSGVYKLQYFNDLVIAGSGAGEVFLINIQEPSVIQRNRIHEQHVFDVLAIGNHIYTAGGDGRVCCLNEKFEIENTISLGSFKVRKLLLHPDGKHLIAGCGDGTIKILSSSTLQVTETIDAHQHGFSVNTLCFTPDKKYLLTASRDAHLNVFDVPNHLQQVNSIAAHNYAIYDMAFAADGHNLATVSRDKKVKIWSPELTVLARIDQEHFAAHKNSVNTLAWLNNERLLTAGDDRSIMLWQIN